MKRILMVGMLLIGGWARAAVDYSQTFTGGTVLQGNPVGTAFTGNFNMDPNSDTVLSMTVGLDISGGYSGGFVIYLVGPDGSTTVTLLNTPVTATPLGASFNITLADAANGGTAFGPSTDFSANYPSSGGTYLPSGSLSGLNGQTVNGNWTLYFADLSSGGGNATLNTWTLDIIDVVPEPITYALAAFGLVFVGIGTGRFYLARRRSARAS